MKANQKVLVVGSGGREHAIVLALKKSKYVGEIIVAPGNAGMESIAKCIYDVSATDIPAMVMLAKTESVDFVVVAPDDPLAMGMVDALEAEGIPAFGPNAKAAQIESSKTFAKDIMKKAGIKTAKAEVFTDAALAKGYIDKVGAPIVVKADGLAKGKGVIIAMTSDEAKNAVDSILCDNIFGSAGSSVLIEEFLDGVEASFICFCDGKTAKPLVSSQDHKRLGDGDTGKNTGGMGAIAPSPLFDAKMTDTALNEVIIPALKAMNDVGCPFCGVLYAGVMITDNGMFVLEFNARFGDPETQVILPLLESDILEIMYACRNGSLSECDVKIENAACAIVIMASGGYPDSYPKGLEITGIDAAEKGKNTWVIHAGTKYSAGKLVTNGGRVLGVCAKAKTHKEALALCYEGVNKIHFDGAVYRHDIGKSALEV